MASVSHAEKNTSRTTFVDWENRCEEFGNTSKNVCANSFELRKASAVARLETQVQTRWDTYHNEHRLSDRIWTVQDRQRQLKEALHDIAAETGKLTEVKRQLENALQALTVPFAIAAECVSLRDERREAEVTRDQPTVELRQEIQILESHKAKLVGLGTEGWQNQENLEMLYQEILLAATEQFTALQIDSEALNLTQSSPGISLRPEPTRLAPQGSVPAAWDNHCQLLVQRQCEACAASRNLRAAILNAIAQAQNSTLAQFEEVDSSLRTRAFTIRRALNDLQWQRSQILNEMARLRKELQRLEDSYHSLEPPRKLCETRHELRTSRPAGPERCQDDPQDGLALQSVTINCAQKRLQNTILEARRTHESLRSQLARVERDIDDKRAALALEQRCQATRRGVTSLHEVHEAQADSTQL